MKRIYFTLIILILIQFTSVCQIFKADVSSTEIGYFFHLPRTALEFEFTITESRFTPGELSNFAAEYFQTRPEYSKSKSSYSLENVSVLQIPVPDPAQKFKLIAKSFDKMSIQIVSGGIIKSINGNTESKIGKNPAGITSSFSRNDESLDSKTPFFSLGTRSDTIINREITPDSTIIERRIINRRTVTNTPDEMAKESVKKLDEIRKTRYMLISGPEDIVMDGKSLEISLQELEKTEQELLALFFGNTKKLKQTYRISYIPGESTDTLFYLSTESGVSISESQNFYPVRISLKPFSEKKAEESTQTENTNDGIIPYRIPQKMILNIVWIGSKYFETELMIPQFGEVHMLPFKNINSLRIIYDENTGIIESIGPLITK